MGAIHRAGTYACSFKPPKPPESYSAIRVDFSQNQQLILTKKLGDPGVEINGARIYVTLTQEETLLFQPSAVSPMGRQKNGPVFVQFRCYAGALDAPASNCWARQVFDSESEEVLPNV